jgi:7-cyano-7-deazaguanine reductase
MSSGAKFSRIKLPPCPRGGMLIDVFFQKGKLPQGVQVPETGVVPY